MDKTSLLKTLEQEIKFSKSKVFMAGKALAQLSLIYVNRVDISAGLTDSCFVGGATLYIYFFWFALLYILHWGKGLRPD